VSFFDTAREHGEMDTARGHGRVDTARGHGGMDTARVSFFDTARGHGPWTRVVCTELKRREVCRQHTVL